MSANIDEIKRIAAEMTREKREKQKADEAESVRNADRVAFETACYAVHDYQGTDRAEWARLIAEMGFVLERKKLLPLLDTMPAGDELRLLTYRIAVDLVRLAMKNPNEVAQIMADQNNWPAVEGLQRTFSSADMVRAWLRTGLMEHVISQRKLPESNRPTGITSTETQTVSKEYPNEATEALEAVASHSARETPPAENTTATQQNRNQEPRVDLTIHLPPNAVELIPGLAGNPTMVLNLAQSQADILKMTPEEREKLHRENMEHLMSKTDESLRAKLLAVDEKILETLRSQMRGPSGTQDDLTDVEKAIVIYTRDPNQSLREVARKVKCDPSLLSRDPRFKRLRQAYQGRIPKGSKTKNGDVEAEEEDAE